VLWWDTVLEDLATSTFWMKHDVKEARSSEMLASYCNTTWLYIPEDFDLIVTYFECFTSREKAPDIHWIGGSDPSHSEHSDEEVFTYPYWEANSSCPIHSQSHVLSIFNKSNITAIFISA
jgi:hypothetical protein